MAKQKVVLKLSMENNKQRAKALKCVTKLHGIVSVLADDDKITVVGEGIDSVELATMLRKKMGFVELVMVTPEKEEKTVLDVKNMQPLLCAASESFGGESGVAISPRCIWF